MRSPVTATRPSISVVTAPGSTTMTFTPSGSTSRRNASLTASSANFVDNSPRKARSSATSDPQSFVVHHSNTVICDDPYNLLVRIEFHKLASLRAFLIHVIKNNAGESPHHIQKFEGEAWVCFKPSLEITAQGFFTCDSPGFVIQELRCNGRCQNDLRSIVSHNGIEIVGIPCEHPMLRKLSSLSFREHSMCLPKRASVLQSRNRAAPKTAFNSPTQMPSRRRGVRPLNVKTVRHPNRHPSLREPNEASPRGVGMRRATRSEITPPWESRSPRLPIQPFLDMHRTPLLLQSLATGRQPILPPYTSPIFRRTSSVAISSAAARYSGRLPALDPQKTQIRF